MSAVLNQAALALPAHARADEIKSALKKIRNVGRAINIHYLAEHPDLKGDGHLLIAGTYHPTAVRQLGAGESVEVVLAELEIPEKMWSSGTVSIKETSDGLKIEYKNSGESIEIPYEAIYAITPMFTGYVLPFRKTVLEKLPLPA